MNNNMLNDCLPTHYIHDSYFRTGKLDNNGDCYSPRTHIYLLIDDVNCLRFQTQYQKAIHANMSSEFCNCAKDGLISSDYGFNIRGDIAPISRVIIFFVNTDSYRSNWRGMHEARYNLVSLMNFAFSESPCFGGVETFEADVPTLNNWHSATKDAIPRNLPQITGSASI